MGSALEIQRTGTSFVSQLPQPKQVIILVGGALSISGTTSAEPNRVEQNSFVVSSTASRPSGELVPYVLSLSSERALSELRRISGLTWGQLAQLFEVSRRSIHFWASGKPLSAANEERLLKALDVVRSADRGEAGRNRAALFASFEGVTPFDLLKQKQFGAALSALGEGVVRQNTERSPLSSEAKAKRLPPPPESLVAFAQEVVHKPGRGRVAKVARAKSRDVT